MSYLSLSEALSPEDAALRDAWVADFRATWNERRLEERVAELPSSVALRRALLVAMVGVDLERRRALGRHPLLDSYFDLYPELHDADKARALSSVAAAPTFGKYRLERVLGKGGMGEVWLATDTTLDRQVALKRPLTADATLITRLRREAKLVAALDGHPGVCRGRRTGGRRRTQGARDGAAPLQPGDDVGVHRTRGGFDVGEFRSQGAVTPSLPRKENGAG